MEEFGVYSLEEEDYNGLFITQESSNDANLSGEVINKEDSEMIDTEVPGEVSGEGGVVQPIYSDISDPEDDFVNPVYGRTNM